MCNITFNFYFNLIHDKFTTKKDYKIQFFKGPGYKKNKLGIKYYFYSVYK